MQKVTQHAYKRSYLDHDKVVDTIDIWGGTPEQRLARAKAIKSQNGGQIYTNDRHGFVTWVSPPHDPNS